MMAAMITNISLLTKKLSESEVKKCMVWKKLQMALNMGMDSPPLYQYQLYQEPHPMKVKDANYVTKTSGGYKSHSPQQHQALDAKIAKPMEQLKEETLRVPFIDAIKEIPDFINYLKMLLTKKMPSGNEKLVPITHRVSDIIAITDCDVYRNIPIIVGRPFLATERALMDSEKHEIMFWVKNERVTFKVEKGHLFPIDNGNICTASIAEDEMGRARHESKTSPKKKKAKSNG
ncbi:hypothetical protein HAX54_017798 [Datura stramonium]|uniref:Uncharacterized protein n=1 Tax=Datura stramonium TaxID=4076 RepID=A0ABS8UP53_DATST|nr:hypothetical protein [Datura stramonium]